MHNTLKNFIKIKNEVFDYSNSKNILLPKIIAVSKTHSPDNIIPLIDYGHIHFGENKVQEALSKWVDIKQKYPKIKLHMLGKIQSNKVKYLFPLFDYVHSLDSIKVAEMISKKQLSLNIRPKIFIQINIANEEQKSCILIDEVEEFYRECVNNLKLDIIGFMCLPPESSDPNYYFNKLNNISKKYENCKLSIGMSNDFKIALKHGSSFLRIGSSIFGKRN